MSNTEEYIKLLHKEMEQFIDEGYAKLDQQEHEMRELGLIMYGDYNYYIINPEEYEKDKKICELENEVERLEHRLSNCIELKFKIGQECYVLLGKEIEKITIVGCRIKISKMEDENFTMYSITDSQGYACSVMEEQLFATKEEALKKLEEMGNG